MSAALILRQYNGSHHIGFNDKIPWVGGVNDDSSPPTFEDNIDGQETHSPPFITNPESKQYLWVNEIRRN